MVNDPVGDMLVQIKNAYMAGKSVVVLPHSILKEAVAKVFMEEGYLSSVMAVGIGVKKSLSLTLVYHESVPSLTDIKRKSKPGLRVYVGSGAIPTVVGGMGVAILSTPIGIMTGREAKKKHVGGELLCEAW